MVFDPFAGTGTTLIVAKQLQRRSLGIEIDPKNVSIIKNRINNMRESDNILKYRDNYIFTDILEEIWPFSSEKESKESLRKNPKPYLERQKVLNKYSFGPLFKKHTETPR